MSVLTLSEAKDDLRIYGSEEDARVQALLDAAIQSTSDYIGRPIPWTDESGNAVEVPFVVNAAIRLELRALCYNPDDVHCAAFHSLLATYVKDRAI